MHGRLDDSQSALSADREGIATFKELKELHQDQYLTCYKKNAVM